MLNSHFTLRVRQVLSASQPWLLGLFLSALAGLSLTGHEIGRPLLLFPTLLLLSISLLGTLHLKRLITSPLTLSLALYTFVVVGVTWQFHSDLLTINLAKTTLMFILGWAPLAIGLSRSDVYQNSKPLLLGLALLEATLVLQTVYSYYTGAGEVIDMRDGIRRAYGWAGDGFTPVVILLYLINLMRFKWFRASLLIAMLMLNGAKMGLSLVLLGSIISLPLWHLRLRPIMLSLGILVLGFCAISLRTATMTSPDLPPVASIPEPTPEIQQSAPAIPEEEHRSFAQYFDTGIRATGLGRLITIGAGLTEFSQAPFSGVGLGQSDKPAIFKDAVIHDYFGLKERFSLYPERFLAESHIGNQLAITAAELGFAGLIAFLLFCLTATITATRCYLRSWRTKCDPLSAAASVWIILLVVFNQSAAWFQAASAATLMLSLCLSLCVAQTRTEAP